MCLVSLKSMGGLWLFLALLGGATGCYSSPGSLADRGEEALRSYRLAEAEVAFQGALDRDPTLPRALYGLGWIHLSKGDKTRARLFFERCTRADPRFFGCHRGMGSLHMHMGYFLQAEESFKQALNYKPGDISTLSSLGQLYMATKRFEDADKTLQEVVSLDPDRGEPYFGLAELRFAQGRLDETLNLLKEAERRPLEEAKFKELIHELRARTFAGLAYEAIRGRGDPPLEPYRSEGLKLYNQALAEVDIALETAVLEQKHRLYRMQNTLTEARERLATREDGGEL